MASAPSVVPGVMAYSFKITAKDELHSTCSLGIQVPDKGGRALLMAGRNDVKVVSKCLLFRSIDL